MKPGYQHKDLANSTAGLSVYLYNESGGWTLMCLSMQGGNWDPSSMRNLLGAPMGTGLHPQLSGSANALTGLPGVPLARNPSDAGSEHNLSLHNLRSKSPWEGVHGMFKLLC